MSDHDPKDMLKTASEAENIGEMDEENGDEIFDKMIEDLVHVESRPSDEMPVIPLRGISIFPTMVIHFDVGREKSVSALEYAMLSDQTVFLVTQKNSETDLPTPDDFYQFGTVARIKQMLRLPGNAIRVLVEEKSSRCCRMCLISERRSNMCRNLKISRTILRRKRSEELSSASLWITWKCRRN